MCGPIRTNRSLVALMTRYRGLRRLAAGVTVVPEDPEILSYFDRVIARDGTDDAHFDLALADPWRRLPHEDPTRPVLRLRRAIVAASGTSRQGIVRSMQWPSVSSNPSRSGSRVEASCASTR